jgi:outer membrane protein TolC
MPRLIRLLAVGTAIACLAATGARSQPYATDPSSLPLPETYFPALKEILSAAVSQSPRMVARNAENAAAEGNRIVMRSGQLPSFGGYFGYFPWERDWRADLPRYADVNRMNFNFAINQPIYHWGALQNTTRIGEIQLRMTEGQTAEGYRILVQEIRGQYLALVIKKAALAKARLSLHMAEDNVAVSQTKLEKKVISEGDMFLARLGLDRSKLATDQGEEDFNYTKLYFAKLCGAPALSDSQIPDEIPDAMGQAPALEPMLSTYTGQKELNSYNLRYLSDQIEVEKLTYQNITTRLRPQLNFQIATSQDQTSYTTNIAAKYRLTSIYTGFMVNWSIFDGFATRGAAASSLAHRRELEQSYKDLSANLTDQARNQLKQVGFARRGMEIANRLLESSSGALRDKKADAARGLASDVDVNTFQLAYHEAQISAFSARSDYLMKTADFLSTLLQDPALANLPKKP